MIYPVIVVSVFATSILSGILGMAGGMVLMAILVTALSVANAMILHGAVQATANGSRAWFLRRHIRWRLLPAYLFGAAAALLVFAALTLVPNAAVVLILVGLFPWLGRIYKPLGGLDITHRPTTVACGFIVTAAQLLAGASGPLLDVFYLKSPLNRHEIVANKAVTQTLGHILKMVYYGLIISVSTDLPVWLFVAAIIVAVAGTRVGTLVLEKLSDAAFLRVSQQIILTIASVCIVQGLWTLTSPLLKQWLA